MAKVFVSYCDADLAAALRLSEDLRARSHDVWLDEWNIAVGDSIVERVESGLVQSSYLVICMSSAGTTSPGMRREWMSFLYRQLLGNPIRVLPVLLPGGSPPAILADIRYADLSADWSSGVEMLSAALSGTVSQPWT